MRNKTAPKIGVIIIGRNEGERLVRCLESTDGQVDHIVYVDSGSNDDSVAMAKSKGVSIVELDLSSPFTAGRARNAGFNRLYELDACINYVQFIDGDCELIEGWLEAAVSALQENDSCAIACGRLKEKNPESSIFNTLCDMEWDTPVGFVNGCGGIFMVKSSVFEELGGFKESLVAGEEPELCVRVRKAGFSIHRIAEDMAWHDANIYHFSQWWKRAVRSGHAYAEGAWLHGNSSEKHWVRETKSNWLWGGSFPLLLLLSLIWPSALMLMLVYPLQMFRISRRACLHRTKRERRLFAIFCVLAKLPLMQGQTKFHINRLFGSKSRIIEYK